MSRHPARVCAADYPHAGHRDFDREGLWRCPGVTIRADDRLQPVKARRDTVAYLRMLASSVHTAISTWAAGGMTFDEAYRLRPRRVEEYPENDLEAWRELAAFAGRLASSAADLEAYANRRAREVEQEQRRRARERGAVNL